jgi:hypothetical protein
MGDDEAERAALGVDGSAIDGVRDENFGVRDARIQFGEREDYLVAVLGFRNHEAGHEFSAKLIAVRDTRSLQQLLQQNALVGFGFILVLICDVKDCPGQVFQVGDSQRERRGNRAADFELRSGRRSLGGRLVGEGENGKTGRHGKCENDSSPASIHDGVPYWQRDDLDSIAFRA